MSMRRRRQLSFICLSLLSAVCYTIWFWHDRLHCIPNALYHRVWQTTGDTLYDRSKLVQWRQWEHAFDGRMRSTGDAVRCANVMLASLGDPFTVLIEPAGAEKIRRTQNGKFRGLGIVYQQIGSGVEIKQVLENSAAQLAGLRSGDVLCRINNHSLAGLPLPQVAGLMASKTIPVSLVVRRGEHETLNVQVEPKVVELRNVQCRSLKGGVGYLRIKDFLQLDTAESVASSLKRLKGCGALVVDLRANPGGGVNECLKTAGLFLDHGLLVTLLRRENGTYFYENNELKEDCLERTVTYQATGESIVDSIERLPCSWGEVNMALLVDGATVSAAEMFAAALQENHRCVVVGERTYGKGVGQSSHAPGNGTWLSVTSARYFTPRGRWLGDGVVDGKRRYGVVPDVIVKSSPNSFPMPGQIQSDIQLARAVELLDRATGHYEGTASGAEFQHDAE